MLVNLFQRLLHYSFFHFNDDHIVEGKVRRRLLSEAEKNEEASETEGRGITNTIASSLSSVVII